jgi:acetyl-CoA synthetase (ADP-forming)
LPPEIVDHLVKNAMDEGRSSLLEPEAKQVCAAYGMPTPDFRIARSGDEAAKSAEEVSFPVVLKIISPDIIHKTESGGVLLDLNSKDQARQGYDQILTKVRTYNEKARIIGVLVQHMAPRGVEVIIGGLQDSQFGPTVLFGLGGIFVEVLKDASFRVAPIADLDCEQMIHEIHSYPILKGVRGQPASDEEAIVKIIKATSKAMVENPVIQQMDLNPVTVYDTGASVVDARIILSHSANQ